MNAGYGSLFKSTRLGQTPKFAKRILGFKYLNKSDFMVDLDQAEAHRLLGLATRAVGGPDTPAPILVLGVMPRAGSNFLRDILVEHPGVYPDPGHLYEFPLLHAAGSARAFMQDFIAMFPRNREVLGQWDALAMLAGAWMRELQAEAGDKRILLKCPHVQYLNLAPIIFPTAKILICVRDGRDVADSTLRTFKRLSITRKTLAQIAHEWTLGTQAALTFDGGANAHPNVHVVRYEDLVRNAETMLPTVLNFLQLDVDSYPFEKVAALPVRGSSRSEHSDKTRWEPQDKPKKFNPIGRWEGWTQSQKISFGKIAANTLADAGYD